MTPEKLLRGDAPQIAFPAVHAPYDAIAVNLHVRDRRMIEQFITAVPESLGARGAAVCVRTKCAQPEAEGHRRGGSEQEPGDGMSVEHHAADEC